MIYLDNSDDNDNGRGVRHLFHGGICGDSLHGHHLALEVGGHAHGPVQRLSHREGERDGQTGQAGVGRQTVPRQRFGYTL